MNLPQLTESDARGQETHRRERHHAALIAAIVCHIWQDRTRIGPSVRQQPPRFSNIIETEAWHDFHLGLGLRSFRDFYVNCGFQAAG